MEQGRRRRRVPGQSDADDDVPQLGGIAPEGGKGSRSDQLEVLDQILVTGLYVCRIPRPSDVPGWPDAL